MPPPHANAAAGANRLGARVRVPKVVAAAVAVLARPIPARTKAPLPPSAGSVPAYWPPLNRRSTSAQPLRSPRQAA